MMRIFLIMLWFTLIINGFYFVNRKSVEHREHSQNKVTNLPPLANLPTNIINVLTIGHKGLYDDLISIWLLQALVDKDLERSSVTEINDFINSILRHEPKLETAYLLSCYILALQIKSPESCEQISLYGLKAFPHSWRIPMTQGFVFAFQLNQRAKAGAFYRIAASRPESPEYVARLADKMMQENPLTEDEIEAARALMQQVHGSELFFDWLNRHRNPDSIDKE
jgi:hypothetical protein